MSTIITIEDIHSYTEVNYIINHMNERYVEMIPKKLRDFFANLSDPNYEININPHIPLESQGLRRYTLEIIAIMHLKYWCTNEERKQELYNIMLKNEEENLAKSFKYRDNIESLFNSIDDIDSEEEEVDYSKPKKIQKYDIYSKDNDDIKDYTDVVEDEETEEQSENLLVDDKKEDKSLFVRLKKFIIKIFSKN